MEYVSFGRFVTVIHCRGGQGKSRVLGSLYIKCSDFLCCPLFEQSVDLVFVKFVWRHSRIWCRRGKRFRAPGNENYVGKLSKIEESSASIAEEEFLSKCTQIPFFDEEAILFV